MLCSLAADEVEKENSHFVARYELVLAAAILDRDAAPVAVGVRREEQVSACLCRILHAELHRLFDLRVRIGAGREVAVRLLLLCYYRDIRKARLLKSSRYRLESCAVEGRIYNGDIPVDLVSEEDRLLLNFFDEARVNVFTDVSYLALCDEAVKVTGLNAFKDVHRLDPLQDLSRSFRRDLAAVCAVDLVAVVFRGVV